jgi:MtN3 and saliva related transmembrane protein
LFTIENIIGILASTCTAIAAIPQLFKLLKEKKADDISLGMLSTLIIGLGFWVAYGILKSDWIIIISNSLSLLVNTTVMILAIRFKKHT